MGISNCPACTYPRKRDIRHNPRKRAQTARDIRGVADIPYTPPPTPCHATTHGRPMAALRELEVRYDQVGVAGTARLEHYENNRTPRRRRCARRGRAALDAADGHRPAGRRRGLG